MPTITPAEIRAAIEKRAEQHADDDVSYKVLASLFGKRPDRYLVCKYLVGVESTKDMTGGQRVALARWLTGEVSPVFGQPLRPEFEGEYARVLDDALAEAGQGEMMPDDKPRKDMCWVCEGLETQMQIAEEAAKEASLYDDDSAYAAHDDAMNDLHNHRQICAIWQAAQLPKTQEQRLKELGY